LSRDIQRRLSRLETNAASEESTALGAMPPDWPLEDQIEAVLDALRLHRIAGTKQLATDRQIHLMGLACVADALGEEGGEHAFFSGLIVALTPDADGGFRVDAPRLIRVEDLPEGVREHFERMDPAEQPERERWLYEHRHASNQHRERVWGAEERMHAYSAESRRRDRELIERNRVACGLPPLEGEVPGEGVRS
jgi:hypothetical protein